MEHIRTAIENCELRLRNAMLHGKIEELDELIADNLVFVTHLGVIATKEMDLEAYRSGLKMRRIDFIEQTMRLEEMSAVTVTRASLTVEIGEDIFNDELWYTRFWRRRGNLWQVAAGHCSRAAE